MIFKSQGIDLKAIKDKIRTDPSCIKDGGVWKRKIDVSCLVWIGPINKCVTTTRWPLTQFG